MAFDHTGERLVALSGLPVADLELFNGWGAETGGVVCGAAAFDDRCPQEQMVVHVTLYNRGQESIKAATGLPFYAVEVLLRDDPGALVEKDQKAIEQRTRSFTRNNQGKRTYTESLDPGQARTIASIQLQEFYPSLAPGRYDLSVTCGPVEQADRPLAPRLSIVITDGAPL